MGLFDLFKSKKENHPKATITIQTHDFSQAEIQQQFEEEAAKTRAIAQQAIPSKNGLLPHEIAILLSAPRCSTSGNTFPKYWCDKWGILDGQAILEKLLAQGFIRETTAKENIKRLKVAELKDILLEFGIKPSGKKADLIASVEQHIPEEALKEKIPVRDYALTALGEQELEENEYISYFGNTRRYGLTVWDMNQMLASSNSKRYRDCIWGYLNHQEMESMKRLQQDGDLYSYYCRAILGRKDMCDFLLEEDRYHDALRSLAECLYYDLKVKAVFSFRVLLELYIENPQPVTKRVKNPETGESDVVLDSSPPKFSEKATTRLYCRTLNTIQKELELSDDELHEALWMEFSNLSIAYDSIKDRNITILSISDRELANLAIAEVNENLEAADRIYQKIESELKEDKRPAFSRR